MKNTSAGREDGADGAAPPRALAERTVTAAQWRLVSAVVQGGMQFGVGVLLARLLPPAAFGLIALAMVVTGFASSVSDLGLGAAVIQRRDLTERHLQVSFTASMAMGLALAAVLVMLSPLSAPLLRDPAVPGVLRAESLVFVFGALGSTSRAMLRRELRFQPLFWTGFLSYVVGYAAVATGMALLGYGVWSLVAGALVQALVESLLCLAVSRHSLRPLLARAELRELFGFGAGASFNNVINYVARNADNLIVGRWLGEAALGLYGRAYNLMTLPLNYLGVATHQVLFPAMAEIQDDLPRMGRAYLTSVQVTTLVTVPVMAGMAVAAPHMIVALYGGVWAGMVLPLQVLCIAGIFRAIYHLAGSVTYAAGQVYAELRRQVGYAAFVVVGGLAGTHWGVSGVAIGVTLAIVYMYLTMARLVLRIVKLGWSDFLGAQLPGVALGGFVASAALLVRLGMERAGYGSGATFVAILAACVAALPAGLYLLPRRMRPAAVYDRLGATIGRLPLPLQGAMTRILRLSSTPVAP